MGPIRSGRPAGAVQSTTTRRRARRRVTGWCAGLAVSGAAVATVALPTSASASSPDVTVTSVPQFGNVLSTGAGRPLYTFGNDHNGVSACTGACLQVWPPLTVATGATPTTGAGVPPGSLGTAVQSDGRNQVTWNGLPLYTFVSDTPGSASGNNVGGFSVVRVTPVSPTTTTPTPTTVPTTAPGTPSTTTARAPSATTTVPAAASPSASTSAGGSTTGTQGASGQKALAFTGAGEWLRGFALAGSALVGVGGLALLLPVVGRRRSARPLI